MTIYFSASSGGFYNSDIHGSTPEDAIAISSVEYQDLLAANAEGKQIMAGDDGKPIAIAAGSLLTDAERLQMLRNRRDRLLRECDYIMMADYPISEADRAAWADYRQALRDLPETLNSDPTSVIWPEAPDSTNQAPD